MKAWTVKFTGHYPVGACAVVVALDVETAAFILHADLAERGLSQVIPLGAFEPLNLEISNSQVILDGEY